MCAPVHCAIVEVTPNAVVEEQQMKANTPLIDIGLALDLVATAAVEPQQRPVVRLVPTSSSRYAEPAVPPGIVGRALSLAQVGADDLAELREHGVRELYKRGRLRDRLTLGAVAVLDAVERGQDRGEDLVYVLEDAAGVAERFIDLLPDSLLDVASQPISVLATPCVAAVGR
jgi:hypothetical protein